MAKLSNKDRYVRVVTKLVNNNTQAHDEVTFVHIDTGHKNPNNVSNLREPPEIGTNGNTPVNSQNRLTIISNPIGTHKILPIKKKFFFKLFQSDQQAWESNDNTKKSTQIYGSHHNDNGI